MPFAYADLAAGRARPCCRSAGRAAAGHPLGRAAKPRRGDPHLHRRADAGGRRHRADAGGLHVEDGRARAHARRHQARRQPPPRRRGRRGGRGRAGRRAAAAAAGIWASPPRSGSTESAGLSRRCASRCSRPATRCASPATALPPGAIYDANRFMLHGAAARAWAARSPISASCPTAPRRSRTRSPTAARGHDLIVTSGGVSTGEEDHVKAAIEALGTPRISGGSRSSRAGRSRWARSAACRSSGCPATRSR